MIGRDLIQSRFLDWSERRFGSGDERLIALEDFRQIAGEIGLENAERGPLHAFRFVLTV